MRSPIRRQSPSPFSSCQVVDARLGAWLLSGSDGCSFRVWAPHPEAARVEIRRKNRGGEGGGEWEGVEAVEMKREGNEWACYAADVREVRAGMDCTMDKHVVSACVNM